MKNSVLRLQEQGALTVVPSSTIPDNKPIVVSIPSRFVISVSFETLAAVKEPCNWDEAWFSQYE